MRVTTSMMYSRMLDNVQGNMGTFRTKQSIVSAERRIFNPSDDPQGTSQATGYRTDASTYEKYKNNMKEARSRLEMTEHVLDEMNTLLISAREYGEVSSSEATTPETRDINAQQIDNIINQAIDLANTQHLGRYLLGGYQTDTPPFSFTGNVMEPYAHQDNTYEGDLEVLGDFAGDDTKEYLIQITGDGGLGTATYQISEDGGTTWSSDQTISSTIALYDEDNGVNTGLSLQLSSGTFATGDKFKVNVERGGFQGDDGKIAMHAGKYTNINTNITGEEAVVDTGYLDTLLKLKYAMENDNTEEISDALAELENVQTEFQRQTVKVGTYLNHVELAENNLTEMHTNTLENLNNVEKPDMVEALMELQMAEDALNTAVSAMSKLIPDSLINYI